MAAGGAAAAAHGVALVVYLHLFGRAINSLHGRHTDQLFNDIKQDQKCIICRHTGSTFVNATQRSFAYFTATTYNMLKVSRNLFRWTKEIAYANYYERALINGVLSIQRGTDPGVMIYMLPQAPGGSKAVSYHGWGTKYDSFWCCYGTGIESFSKPGNSIYFEEKGETPALSIIQYIPSTFNWKTAGVTVTQQLEPLSTSDMNLQVSLSFSGKNGQSATLNVRIPTWTSASGAKATLNDKDLGSVTPGSLLSVTKQWNSNDHLSLQFPIALRTEVIKDDRPEYASLQAILFGPFVLAGLSSSDCDAKTGSAISDWITEHPPVPLQLTLRIRARAFVLGIHEFDDRDLPCLCYSCVHACPL